MRLNKGPFETHRTLTMIIRMKKLTQRLSLSESTIRRMMDEGRFPHSVSLSKGTVGWRIRDIEEWENNL